MSDVIIIGSGPAGISASLYCVRANLNTTVIGSPKGALKSADKIENYYGFPGGISGAKLLGSGIEQAKALGVKVIDDEVFSIGVDAKRYTVSTKSTQFSADGIIIATGSKRSAPAIKGLKDFEGKGVSFCAVCDAFFYRNKNVAVLGDGEYALHEINDLLPVVGSVTLLTNGINQTVTPPDNVKVITTKITEIKGDVKLGSIVFDDGKELSFDGLFIATGVAGSVALAKKIGAVTDGTKIRVDENMKTSIKNIYAAGDCTGGLLQISKAVYDGARAATELIKSLRKQ